MPLPESQIPPERTREIVAQFRDPAQLEAAVTALRAAGFDRTDLSVLASHDTLDVAGPVAGYPGAGPDGIGAAIGAELPWLAPVAFAGVILAVSGPVGLAVAALVGGAAGAVALRTVLAEVTETVHAERYAEAVERGNILLWVRTRDAATVARAEATLAAAGGSQLTRHTTATRESAAD